MYETYFGFCQRPFAATPRVDQYVPTAAIESARQSLVRCIQRGEGAGLVIGPSGTGKTLLLAMLAEQFKNAFRVVQLSRSGVTTRRALLQTILYELRLPYRDMDEGEVRLALVDHVTDSQKCPRGLLLLVDEAHHLPLRLLDEVRALTNLAADGQPRVRLVLAGGAILEERFASPKLESFSQRIVARGYLEALNRTETQTFVHRQIETVGGRGEAVFPQATCEAVHRATDGVPRLVSQVCDHALLLACAAGTSHVSEACIEEAWADLQQLPTPWSAGSPPAGAAASQESIIEFGGLDDEGPAESAAAANDAGEPDTVPMLRVTDQDEDYHPQPLDQLQRIENTLAELEHGFEPAGSIGPEVELVFPDSSNPFSEHFAEEEVIVDRHTAGARPRTPQAGNAPAAPAAGRTEVTIVVGDTALVRPGVSRTLVGLGRRADSPAATDAAYRAAQAQRRVADDSAPTTLPLRREEPVTPSPDDSDLIALDDNYDDLGVPPPRPVTPVRHFEYRRLFARLRHG